jgi:hypothetical protein
MMDVRSSYLLCFLGAAPTTDPSAEFTIPQLVAGNHYSGPSDSSVTDTCECNTVYYSLISACAGCQRGIWLSYALYQASPALFIVTHIFRYDQWHAGCKTVEPDSTSVPTVHHDHASAILSGLVEQVSSGNNQPNSRTRMGIPERHCVSDPLSYSSFLTSVRPVEF